MAAAWHGLGPTTELKVVNTMKVVGRASLWFGLEAQEINDYWKSAAFDCDDGETPALKSRTEDVYDELVDMVQSFRPALIEGGGNWGQPGKFPPAHPYFNACRLTELGEQIASALLLDNPRYCKPAGQP
jgi:hypothetical protein